MAAGQFAHLCAATVHDRRDMGVEAQAALVKSTGFLDPQMEGENHPQEGEPEDEPIDHGARMLLRFSEVTRLRIV